MVRYGRLDIGLVWQSLSGPVINAWRGWERSVRVYRDLDPEAYTEFEDLYAQALQYEKRRRRLWFRIYRWVRSYVW